MSDPKYFPHALSLISGAGHGKGCGSGEVPGVLRPDTEGAQNGL